MNDGRTKTIPLRRARANGRLEVGARFGQWRDRIGHGAQTLTAPPRQLWLATLGSVALTVRATQALWSRIVSEGESAERWLRGSWTGGAASRSPDS